VLLRSERSSRASSEVVSRTSPTSLSPPSLQHAQPPFERTTVSPGAFRYPHLHYNDADDLATLQVALDARHLSMQSADLAAIAQSKAALLHVTAAHSDRSSPSSAPHSRSQSRTRGQSHPGISRAVRLEVMQALQREHEDAVAQVQSLKSQLPALALAPQLQPQLVEPPLPSLESSQALFWPSRPRSAPRVRGSAQLEKQLPQHQQQHHYQQQQQQRQRQQLNYQLPNPATPASARLPLRTVDIESPRPLLSFERSAAASVSHYAGVESARPAPSTPVVAARPSPVPLPVAASPFAADSLASQHGPRPPPRLAPHVAPAAPLSHIIAEAGLGSRGVDCGVQRQVMPRLTGTAPVAPKLPPAAAAVLIASTSSASTPHRYEHGGRDALRDRDPQSHSPSAVVPVERTPQRRYR
jgi:hypothetical protein